MTKDMVKVPQIRILFESAEMTNITSYTKLPNGHIEFDGILQTVDEINRNANCYPRDVLMEAIGHPRIADTVSRRAWFGEGSHPWDRKNFQRSIDIYPKEITHRICQVPYLKGDKLMSRIRTVEPCGKTVVSWVVDEGSQLGFSMRGVTPYSIDKESPVKHRLIKSPMSILTFDIVFYPSHPEALMMVNASSAITAAQECAYSWLDVANYITDESPSFKLFHDELGITFKKGEALQRRGYSSISCTLEDGRLAEINLEQSILHEVGKYI